MMPKGQACSLCGARGHNRQTCGKPPADLSAINQAVAKLSRAERERQAIQRYWDNVPRASIGSCWEYKKAGSGAHVRKMWVSLNGPIPTDGPRLCVCHRCDNPKCVNPFHLFLGTYAQNLQDATWKGRYSKQKLEPQQRQALVLKLLKGEYQSDLAREFGISRQRVHQIKNNLQIAVARLKKKA